MEWWSNNSWLDSRFYLLIDSTWDHWTTLIQQLYAVNILSLKIYTFFSTISRRKIIIYGQYVDNTWKYINNVFDIIYFQTVIPSKNYLNIVLKLFFPAQKTLLKKDEIRILSKVLVNGHLLIRETILKEIEGHFWFTIKYNQFIVYLIDVTSTNVLVF